MTEVFIIAAKRTPLGSFGGQFAKTSAIDLAATSIKATLEQSGIKAEEIDEVFYGNVVSSNLGQAPAKQAALKGGLPDKTPCTAINKVCASGMKSLLIGAQSIQTGDNNCILAGGMENMSQIPFYLEKARYGYGYGNSMLLDGLYRDGLQDAYAKEAMGCFADATATKHEISRQQQDDYAINSYKRAAQAWEKGLFNEEVCEVENIDRKGNSTFIKEDEEYKKVMFEKIPKLRPVFSKEGTVTAANASTINDGAATLIAVSKEYLEKHNLKPLAKIISFADGSREPEWFTTAPIIAADKALKKANLTIKDIEYFEVNEAFSVVPLAFAKNYDLDLEIVNVLGGAVSLGHPLGCSGARIICTLLSVLKHKSAKIGMAAICNGGGGASALIVERM